VLFSAFYTLWPECIFAGNKGALPLVQNRPPALKGCFYLQDIDPF